MEKGVLFVDFKERRTRITADVYCETFNKFRCAIKNKRHGKLSSGVIPLQENAHSHTADKTNVKMKNSSHELFDHPTTHRRDTTCIW